MTEEIVIQQDKRVPWNKGRTDVYSQETLQKMTLARKGKRHPKISGENNYSWKGDSVGYRALHQWVNIHKPKPLDGLCEFCNIKPCEHLACVTYTYTRDFGNWKYLCSKCHNRFDLERAGRLTHKDRKRLLINGDMLDGSYSISSKTYMSVVTVMSGISAHRRNLF